MKDAWWSGYIAGAGAGICGWGLDLIFSGRPFGYLLLGLGLVAHFSVTFLGRRI
jgi:hypothetical protein